MLGSREMYASVGGVEELIGGPDTPSKVTVSSVSYTHLRAHETPEHLVCRLLLEKKKPYPTEDC